MKIIIFLLMSIFILSILIYKKNNKEMFQQPDIGNNVFVLQETIKNFDKKTGEL